MLASGITVKSYMYGPKDDETTVVLQTGNVHVNARFPNFSQASRIHLAHLETGGARVKVFGRIDEIEHGMVNLGDCEIVDLKLPSPG